MVFHLFLAVVTIQPGRQFVPLFLDNLSDAFLVFSLCGRFFLRFFRTHSVKTWIASERNIKKADTVHENLECVRKLSRKKKIQTVYQAE